MIRPLHVIRLQCALYRLHAAFPGTSWHTQTQTHTKNLHLPPLPRCSYDQIYKLPSVEEISFLNLYVLSCLVNISGISANVSPNKYLPSSETCLNSLPRMASLLVLCSALCLMMQERKCSVFSKLQTCRAGKEGSLAEDPVWLSAFTCSISQHL